MQEVPADKPLSSASPGAMLRAAREARDLSVHKAAQDMHVSDDILLALERDDYTSLGAPIFVRGHLRNYARLLGLSEDAVLDAEHSADKLAPPPLVTLHPDGGRALGRFGLPVFSVVVVVVLVILAVVWWQHRPAEQPTALVEEHAAGVATTPVATPLPAATLAAVSAAGINAHQPAEPLRAEPEIIKPPGVQPVLVTKAKPPSASKPAAVTPAHVKPAHISVVEPGAVPASQLTHAQFSLSQPSWIEVYDASGKRLYYDLAPAGDTLTVSGAGPLQVFLGNAPGVSIELNGAPFNQTPFTHPDNTARFRLGEANDNSGQAG